MSGLAGEIVSPGYPDNYPNNSVCEWTITGREGDRIRLTFTDFALEDSLNCQLDSLEVTSTFLYQILSHTITCEMCLDFWQCLIVLRGSYADKLT